MAGVPLHHVYALAVRDGTVYAGGDFQLIGGANRNCLAALDPITGAATAWNPDVSGPPGIALPRVLDIDFIADGLVAGGEFTKVGGKLRQGLAVIVR